MRHVVRARARAPARPPPSPLPFPPPFQKTLSKDLLPRQTTASTSSLNIDPDSRPTFGSFDGVEQSDRFRIDETTAFDDNPGGGYKVDGVTPRLVLDGSKETGASRRPDYRQAAYQLENSDLSTVLTCTVPKYEWAVPDVPPPPAALSLRRSRCATPETSSRKHPSRFDCGFPSRSVTLEFQKFSDRASGRSLEEVMETGREVRHSLCGHRQGVASPLRWDAGARRRARRARA